MSDRSAAQLFCRSRPSIPLPLEEGAFGLSGVVAPTRLNVRRGATDGLGGRWAGELAPDPDDGVSSSPAFDFAEPFPSDMAEAGCLPGAFLDISKYPRSVGCFPDFAEEVPVPWSPTCRRRFFGGVAGGGVGEGSTLGTPSSSAAFARTSGFACDHSSSSSYLEGTVHSSLSQ